MQDGGMIPVDKISFFDGAGSRETIYTKFGHGLDRVILSLLSQDMTMFEQDWLGPPQPSESFFVCDIYRIDGI